MLHSLAHGRCLVNAAEVKKERSTEKQHLTQRQKAASSFHFLMTEIKSGHVFAQTFLGQKRVHTLM